MMAQLFWMANKNPEYWNARDLPIYARTLREAGNGGELTLAIGDRVRNRSDEEWRVG
jgi:hypothetical protein